MKIVRFRRGSEIRYGVLSGDVIEILEGAPFEAIRRTGETTDLSEVRLLAPVVPLKIRFCAGLPLSLSCASCLLTPPAELERGRQPLP